MNNLLTAINTVAVAYLFYVIIKMYVQHEQAHAKLREEEAKNKKLKKEISHYVKR